MNTDIREAIKQAGVRYWQVAECLGINDGNFSRKLRRELTADEKERVFRAIERLKAAADEKEGGSVNNG